MSVLILSIILILSGLAMVYLSPSAKFTLLMLVVFWAGIILIIVGLILLVTPVLIWAYGHIRSAIGG